MIWRSPSINHKLKLSMLTTSSVEETGSRDGGCQKYSTNYNSAIFSWLYKFGCCRVMSVGFSKKAHQVMFNYIGLVCWKVMPEQILGMESNDEQTLLKLYNSWLINFNGMLIHIGLFYAQRLGNHIHSYIYIFHSCFIRAFFAHIPIKYK